MEKVFKIKNWFHVNLRAGLLSLLYYVINYGIMLGLSFLCVRFLPEYANIGKWVIVGFWGVVNVLIILAYILTMIWGEETVDFSSERIKVDIDAKVLDGLSYKEAMQLVGRVRRKGCFLTLINILVSLIPFYLLIIGGYIFMRNAIVLFDWAILIETALSFELYLVIGVNIIYLIALCILQSTPLYAPLGQQDVEDETRRYCWKECKICGGLVTREIVSIDVERETKDVKVSDAYTDYNHKLKTYVVDNQVIDVYGTKQVSARYKTQTKVYYMTQTIATCRKCGNTYKEKGNLEDAGNREFYSPDGKLIKVNDPKEREEEERRKQELIEKKRRKSI